MDHDGKASQINFIRQGHCFFILCALIVVCYENYIDIVVDSDTISHVAESRIVGIHVVDLAVIVYDGLAEVDLGTVLST